MVATQIRELETRFDQSMRAQNTDVESNIKPKPAIAAISASVTKLDEHVSAAYVKMGENMNDIVNRLAITQKTLQADIDSNADLFRKTDEIMKSCKVTRSIWMLWFARSRHWQTQQSARSESWPQGLRTI